MVLSLNLSGIRGSDFIFPVFKNNNRKHSHSSSMSTKFPALLFSFTRAASWLKPSAKQNAEHKSLWFFSKLVKVNNWASIFNYLDFLNQLLPYNNSRRAQKYGGCSTCELHNEGEACSSWEVTSRPLSPRNPICWINLTFNTERNLWINW